MSGASQDWLCAGHLAGAYGIKGWMRVHSYTDPPENLFKLRDWRLKSRAMDRALSFAEWRAHGKGFIARIDGAADRNDAEALRGCEIWVPAAALPELEEGEYYWRELIGLRADCAHEGSVLHLGQVHALLETGANDVLVLRPCDGSIDDRERLVPWIPGETVLAVEAGEGRILLRWHPDD